MNPRSTLLLLEAMLGRITRWMVRTPKLEAWASLLAMLVLAALWWRGYHLHQMPSLPAPGEAPAGWQPASAWTLRYFSIVPYVKVAALLSGVILNLAMVRAGGDLRRLLVPVWIICGLLAAWLGAADFYEQWERVHGVVTGRPFPFGACVMKVVLLVLGMLSPAVALTYYQGRPIWEKHVLRLFVQPLAFCLVAFCALMLLADFIDNLHDFQDNKVPVVRIVSFYIDLMPALFVKSVPLALLLATLWALLKLVRFNELVSLLCAGLSFTMIMRPLLMCAALLCFVTMVVNYDAAQQAEGERQAVMRGFAEKEPSLLAATSVMHVHESTRRVWFVSAVPFDLRERKLRGVQVRQLDDDGSLVMSISSASVFWLPNGHWIFSRGMVTMYSQGVKTGEFAFNIDVEGKRRYEVSDWPETLWDIVSTTQTPDLMGVPDLASYLKAHSDSSDIRALRQGLSEIWLRFSLPWQGFPLVLLVAAMSPVHSRRGLAQYVGLSIIIYMALIFINNSALSITRAGHVPAWLALWTPHLLLASASLVLLWVRTGAPWKLKNPWRILRGRCTEPLHPAKGFFATNADMRPVSQDKLRS